MKKILIIFILSFMLLGCNNNSNKLDIEKLMQENEYVILDVRTEEEYQESHIVNAINVPYDLIDENINLDKESVIFVYCKSGNRSKIAYDSLTNLGYTVYDLGAFSEIDLDKE